MIEVILILLFSYMVILTERSATVNLGDPRSAFTNIDLCKNKQVYAPFKYRVLGFWLARLFSVTSDKIKVFKVWVERYNWHVYQIGSEGLERYYIFKYILLLLANFMFYWYLTVLGLPALIGVLLLDAFLMITFIYDAFDYLLEIALYSLFLISVFSGWGVVSLLPIAFLASLNRESAIFMIPIAFLYSSLMGVALTTIGFIVGFIIPRIIYRKPVDQYDGAYGTPWKFLVFNPIRNWKESIWPNLRPRFKGVASNLAFEYKGSQSVVQINGGANDLCDKQRMVLK